MLTLFNWPTMFDWITHPPTPFALTNSPAVPLYWQWFLRVDAFSRVEYRKTWFQILLSRRLSSLYNECRFRSALAVLHGVWNTTVFQASGQKCKQIFFSSRIRESVRHLIEWNESVVGGLFSKLTSIRSNIKLIDVNREFEWTRKCVSIVIESPKILNSNQKPGFKKINFAHSTCFLLILAAFYDWFYCLPFSKVKLCFWTE